MSKFGLNLIILSKQPSRYLSWVGDGLGRKVKIVKQEQQEGKKKLVKGKQGKGTEPKKKIKKVENATKKETLSALGEQYWLMKAEPESRIVKGKDVKFSIEDLANMPDQRSPWDGVRNYEARNIMRDRMKLGDQVLFYHSNCKVPGIAGIAKVVKEGYPDDSSQDPHHPYYDPKCPKDQPSKWFRVDIQFVTQFPRILSLKELKLPIHSKALSCMTLLNRAQLSVQPVSQEEFHYICQLASSDSA